jgi:hypothetical protein
MPSLAELQAHFSAYLLAPAGSAPPAALPRGLRDGEAAATERLGVYKNNVYSTLIDALAATFPAVERLVGNEFFRYAAREYIAIHAPRSPMLLGFGHKFPQFLSRFAPAATVPYLPDVAELEFLWLEAYHAPESIGLDAERVSAMLAEPTRGHALRLHPSARLMRSRHPVSRIWELNRSPDEIEGKTRIPSEPEHLLIVRPRTTVEVRRVHPGAYAALEAFAARRSLVDAIAAARRTEPSLDIGAHLVALAAGESFCERE